MRGGVGSVGRGGVGGGSGVPDGVGVVCIRIPAIILLFSEITVVLVRSKHITSFIVNANHKWVRARVLGIATNLSNKSSLPTDTTDV